MTNETRLIKQALNIPYTRWHDIEPLIGETNDEHTKEVLRRLIQVKRNRKENEHGTGTMAVEKHYPSCCIRSGKEIYRQDQPYG